MTKSAFHQTIGSQATDQLVNSVKAPCCIWVLINETPPGGGPAPA